VVYSTEGIPQGVPLLLVELYAERIQIIIFDFYFEPIYPAFGYKEKEISHVG
jgi:hypothetical protein